MAETTEMTATSGKTGDGLHLLVRTPQRVVFEGGVRSLRLPTDTGQVGLRPRAEPAVLVVEPGLVLVTGEVIRFVATAGGLLRWDGARAVLLTPLAVLGEDAGTVEAQLEEALRRPGAELELRQVLQRLERGILEELRRGRSTTAASGGPESG